jgi:hypothetical protein
MLAFIIALKSKKISNSWTLVSDLLERTLRSTCSQISQNFVVIVVCNEKPDIQFEHPRIHYITVDFIPPAISLEGEISKGYENVHSQDVANKTADKVKKCLRGIEYAQQFNPTHLMMTDADDCVSRRLAETVDKEPECDGWILRKGYMYREGSRFLVVNRRRFNHVCATSIIIKNGLESLLFQTNPYFYLASFETLVGAELKSLPFSGAVYSMLNGENMLMSAETFSQMKNQIIKSIPLLFQRLLRFYPWVLTPSIIDEFGLYPVLINPNESE